MQSMIRNQFIKAILKVAGVERADQLSSFAMAKAYREVSIHLRQYIKELLLIGVGVFSAAFGLKGFLLHNDFIDGGATGISLLLSILTDAPLFAFIILINVPFVIMGYHIMGK
ncbi:MAG: YitT family protein, partial [Flavobacteriales bacterium]